MEGRRGHYWSYNHIIRNNIKVHSFDVTQHITMIVFVGCIEGRKKKVKVRVVVHYGQAR
jgi:hypothetical protein